MISRPQFLKYKTLPSGETVAMFYTHVSFRLYWGSPLQNCIYLFNRMDMRQIISDRIEQLEKIDDRYDPAQDLVILAELERRNR